MRGGSGFFWSAGAVVRGDLAAQRARRATGFIAYLFYLIGFETVSCWSRGAGVIARQSSRRLATASPSSIPGAG